ncbi:MAG: MltA domain-containing protein, partial [Desulfopila sp.]|nr:MltA domain-containing protein [Desulfopila sp.]
MVVPICFRYVFSIFLLILLFSGCGRQHQTLFIPQKLPLFSDDGDLVSLQDALQQQMLYTATLEKEKEIDIGGVSYSAAWLDDSLKTFAELLQRNLSTVELGRVIRENFTVYQAGGRQTSLSAEMLVTGYYEPVVEGRLVAEPPFVHPLYALPRDLLEHTGASGEKKIGRIDDQGIFQPYWTRAEIETSDALAGYELVYLQDPVEAFLFHVQGSGRVRLADGTERALQYRANNGHQYSSIGKLLVDEKKISLQEADTAAIRKYLSDNPGELRRVLHHNRRYIFFAWADSAPPRGSIGLPLTPGRSIAIDSKVLPMGAVGYLI